VKTRNQRDVPLMPALADVLRVHLAGRTRGAVFRQRTYRDDPRGLDASSIAALEQELVQRLAREDTTRGEPDRGARVRLAGRLWRMVDPENWTTG
jgi:hypothetical protein